MRYDTTQIERKRKALGWTKTELAHRVGVSYATISRIESGKTQSPKTIKRIADLLQISMEQLLKEDLELKTA